MKKTILTSLIAFGSIMVFGQCNPSVSASATSGFYTGDTLYSGTHHICFNSYLSYFGNGYDTLYLEPQVTLTILWSDNLVIYASDGVNIFKGPNASNNYVIKELNYGDLGSAADTANMTIQSQTYCPGMTFNYGLMPNPPGPSCTGTTASVENNTVSEIKIFPNPASSDITFDFEGLTQSKNLTIFDATGRVVYFINDLNDTYLQLDVTDLKNGIYYVQVESENSVIKQKFIKE